MLKCVVKKLLVRIANIILVLLGIAVFFLVCMGIERLWKWLLYYFPDLPFWALIFALVAAIILVIVLSVNGIVNLIKECKGD